ncbi:MAG: M28 family metallopeptidase [Isosphaeraceae bacterium]|nr:M28 family metallopeptidase [Isosphaeraceae bacterium]
MRSLLCSLAGVVAMTGVAYTADLPPSVAVASECIEPAGLLGHIKTLASDEFEGRGPGSAGEERTVHYLTGQCRALGLKPGNPDGTFIQKVPLAGFQATSVAGALQSGSRTIPLNFLDNFVAVSRRMVPEVSVEDSDVVFVGYGVVAPEYGWDDYKGVDVKGKTIVMLVNDPAVTDPNDPSQLDPAVFKGKAMTYYGRWTYKYEIASQKGAAAAILIHETGPAGYPFEVVKGSWGRENFDLPRAPGAPQRVAVEGWIALDTAKELCSAGGHDFERLKKAAARRDFQPVSLGAEARFEIKNVLREVQSRNVVAKVEGSDPRKKDEVIVYTAHWDHLGRDPALKGDQIFNGAADNASGVAALLEIAQAFSRVQPPPERTILFLAVTAEEKGLLGAKYYAQHPLYPLPKTLADINMDVLNLWGRTRDVNSIGMGLSTLDELFAAAAGRQGRVVTADAEPEKGFFYRSDHFEFAKQGVPALDPKGGVDFVGKPAEYGRQKREEYTKNDYHKVSDEVKTDWDLSGAVEDLRLFFEIGYTLAQGDQYPEWKPGAEFRSTREAMRKGIAP